jgi:hypothetical protein
MLFNYCYNLSNAMKKSAASTKNQGAGSIEEKFPRFRNIAGVLGFGILKVS